MPILIREPSSDLMARILASDEVMTVWWATRIECTSAIRRRERERTISPAAARRGLARLRAISDTWSEIDPRSRLRAEAERALAVHPLRAGDALQLAAALVWRVAPERLDEFVCLDIRLRAAAAREGFVLVPDDDDYAGLVPR